MADQQPVLQQPQPVPPVQQGSQAVDLQQLFNECQSNRTISLKLAEKDDIICKLIQMIGQQQSQLQQYQDLQNAVNVGGDTTPSTAAARQTRVTRKPTPRKGKAKAAIERDSN